MARRVFVFGVDGMILPLTEYLVAAGRLPHIARLLREGALTKVLPFVSTWGPINWMCFATGAAPGSAWRGTTAVPGIEEAEVGDDTPSAYGCETLWEALDRQGRGSAIVSYPASWPPRGLAHTTIAVPDRQSTNLAPLELVRPARYMTADLRDRYRQPPGTQAGWAPLSSRGRRRPASDTLPVPTPPAGWRNLPPGPKLATRFLLMGVGGETLAEIDVLLTDLDGPRPRALFCQGQDAARGIGEDMSTYEATPIGLPYSAAVGEWTPWRQVNLKGRSATVRFRLLELGDGGASLALCHSEVFPLERLAHPRALEPDLMRTVGPYASGSSAHLRPTDPFWATAVEEARYEAAWLIGAAHHLLNREDAALFMTVYRPADSANHDCLAYIDPTLPHYGGRETELAHEILAQAYGAVDHAIGLLMESAEEGDVIVLASDHGAVVNHVTCDIYNLLQEHGLLTLQETAEGGLAVDWARTQAYIRPSRSGSEIFINLRGREPQGAVEPDQYEALQGRIIDLLLDWREPQSGDRSVALALRKRDSALLGYWGDEAGDIQFIYNEGFVWGALPEGTTIARTDIPAVNHGPQIPTAERGLSSNMGMLALWGPGVRQGYRRTASQGPARMTDAAPTIAHMLDLHPPAQSEGAILHDMLDE
jgi:predicted AlkP superfamily phosphohydrolase/phosphomutase